MYRRFAGEKYDHLFIRGRQNRFSKIYENKVWLEGKNTGALSGQGSEFENTENVRKWLPETLIKIKADTLLDIGCGDWTWMQHIKLPCKYIGVDIVPSVIEENRVKFKINNVRFEVLDAVESPLPSSDVILCREVIFHLSLADAKKLLKNITMSNAQFFIATTDTEASMNADIQTGDFRNINLQLKPFNFSAPLITVNDNKIFNGRKLAVWRLSDLPKF